MRGAVDLHRHGTGIREFSQRFPDSDSCLEHIFRTRLGDHTPCPKCGRFGVWSRIKGKNSYLHTCRSHVNVLHGTIFHRSNLPLNAWFYSMLLSANSSHGMRASFLRKQLGIGLKSSHRITSAIRDQMASYNRPAQLGGPGRTVVIDEAQLQRVTNPDHSRQAVVVMGLECDGELISGVIPDRKRDTLIANVARFVRPGSTIITDGFIGYHSLEKLGWKHFAVNHSRAFHDFQGHTTNAVEAYWAVLKRTLRAYRQISMEELPSFLGEVEFRYNRRHAKVSLFDELISGFDLLSVHRADEIEKRFRWNVGPASFV